MPESWMVSFTEIEAGGNFVTVTFEPPRLKRIGSLHALRLTHEDGPPDADVGSRPALPGNPITVTS